MSDKASDEAKDFVASLLVRDPAQRASAAQAMEHPWLSRPRQMPQPALRDAGPGAQRERERERGRKTRQTHFAVLSKHRKVSLLKRQALLTIGYNLDRKSIRTMRDAFRSLDVDGNGRISVAELREGLRLHKVMLLFTVLISLFTTSMRTSATCVVQNVSSYYRMCSLKVSAQLLEDVSNMVDLDASGEIEYTSFVAACLDHRSYHEQSQLYQVFFFFFLLRFLCWQSCLERSITWAMMFSKVLSVVAAYSSTLAQLYYPFILNFYFLFILQKRECGRGERGETGRGERDEREREREREREEKEAFILCFVGASYSNKEAQLYQAFHRFKDKETGAITLASLRKMLGTHSQKCSLYRLYTVNALGR